MCGCKGGNRNSRGSSGIRRNLIPANPPRATQPVLRSQSTLNGSGISAERRKTQAIRRAAIRNNLNK